MYLGVSVEGRSSQQRGGNSFQPQQLSHYSNHVFSLPLPQLGPVLPTSQPQQRCMNTDELWQKKSQYETHLHFLNFVGLKQIDGFVLLIFCSWLTPRDALKAVDEGVTSAAFTWMSSDGWLFTWTMARVTLSHGLHCWNRINFHNTGCARLRPAHVPHT